METLYIATKNPHKVEEFSFLLKDLPFLVRALPEGVEESPESGTSFESNAVEKAAFYAEWCDGWVLADDSGLCVDILDGRPGIYSARYAGVHGDSTRNNEKLLAELAGVPNAERSAVFVAVLALYHRNHGIGVIARGEVRGTITEAPSGVGGFGYDPLFYLPDFGCTYADLAPDVKNSISHRARATEVLIQSWKGIHDATLHSQRQPSISTRTGKRREDGAKN